MRKRIIVFALVLILAVSCMAPTAFAADNGSLQIDSTHQYLNDDGTPKMERTYNEGYTPTVANGYANIVLPLIPVNSTVIKDNVINTSINLGDTASSPFVIKNYDRQFKFGSHKVNGGTMDSFLIEYNLKLSDSRANGVYPVVITTSYFLSDGTPMTQDFTVFVTISDVPAPEPAPEPTDPGGGGGGGGGATSQPKVIISNYTISPDPVNAGEKFNVNVTLENTSKSQTVKNITVTFKSQTTDLMPGDNTNTAYIEKIGAKKTADFSFAMAARADAKAGPQKIDIAIAYEDSAAAQLTATDEISVEVHQKIRLEYDPPKFPSQVYMGDTTSASLNLYNKGKNVLYNVTVTLDVPGLTPESSAFLGNMESGTAKTADIYASVAADPNAGMNGGGMMDGAAGGMTGDAAAFDMKMVGESDVAVIGGADAPTDISVSEEGMAGREKEDASDPAGDAVAPGPVQGNFVVTYEDEYGEEYEIKVPVETELVPMPDYGGGEEIPIEPEQAGFPWWGWVLIAGGAAAVVIVVVVLKKKKKKREQELSEEIDDDDIY